MNIHDAVLALDELGVSMSELSQYAEAEGKDMRKYVAPNREASEMSGKRPHSYNHKFNTSSYIHLQL